MLQLDGERRGLVAVPDEGVGAGAEPAGGVVQSGLLPVPELGRGPG